MEQVFFNVPLDKLEPIFKRWVKEVMEVLPERIISKSEIEQPLTIQQAAGLLNLSVPTIYGLVSKNQIPYMKRSKRLYFSNLELMKYLKDGRNKTNSEIEAEAESEVSNFLKIKKAAK